MKTPLTRERFRHHLHYGWWKYALMAICVLVAVNLLFTTTRYRAPDALRVDVFVCASGADQQALQDYLDTAHEILLPDMEEVNCVVMLTNDGSDPYSAMQLSTYLMAGEGDIYLLSESDFHGYAAQGAMLNLDPYLASGDLDTADVDLRKGTISYREEEDAPLLSHLFGIPTDDLFGFWNFNIDNRGMVLCVSVANGNDDNVVKLLSYMVHTLLMPMPGGSE